MVWGVSRATKGEMNRGEESAPTEACSPARARGLGEL